MREHFKTVFEIIMGSYAVVRNDKYSIYSTHIALVFTSRLSTGQHHSQAVSIDRVAAMFRCHQFHMYSIGECFGFLCSFIIYVGSCDHHHSQDAEQFCHLQDLSYTLL